MFFYRVISGRIQSKNWVINMAIEIQSEVKDNRIMMSIDVSCYLSDDKFLNELAGDLRERLNVFRAENANKALFLNKLVFTDCCIVLGEYLWNIFREFKINLQQLKRLGFLGVLCSNDFCMALSQVLTDMRSLEQFVFVNNPWPCRAKSVQPISNKALTNLVHAISKLPRLSELAFHSLAFNKPLARKLFLLTTKLSNLMCLTLANANLSRDCLTGVKLKGTVTVWLPYNGINSEGRSNVKTDAEQYESRLV